MRLIDGGLGSESGRVRVGGADKLDGLCAT